MISLRSSISFAVFLFFAIALIARSGLSYGPGLLLLASFALFFMQNRPPLIKADYQLMAALVFYFLNCVVMNLIHHASIAEYDVPLRFLYVIPVVALLLVCPPSPCATWAGMSVGAIGGCLYIIWQNLILLQERVHSQGYTDPIQYGNISIVLALLCLAGIGWSTQQRRVVFWTTFLMLGALAGILGSALTGSRGSWIALPFCLIVLYCGSTLNKKYWLIGAIVLAAILTTLYAIPQTTMKDRVAKAFSETSEYIGEHKTGTSVGTRLEMWRTGVMLIEEKPLLGWGKEGYMKHVQELIKDGKVDAVAGQHSHLHNEYMDAWVKDGIPGLIATLALYLAPLILFIKQFKAGNNITQPYALAGIILVIAYLAFGVTQAFLTHNNGVMLYAFAVAILWSMSRRVTSG